jgi:ABC-type branched-subunit amino acid transport system substrate-binding protein
VSVSRRLTALAAAVALATSAAMAKAEPLGEAERRGRQIYLDGSSPSDSDISAIVGDEDVFLPGTAMPCSSCHGSDGQGRPEGGVTPLDIRWSELVKTYGHVHHDGRRHPAFDDRSVRHAVVEGIDPAGNAMDRTMPRYRMSDGDMADLLAYLKVLESDFDPGVGRDHVRVATLLPATGRAAETGEAMRQVLEGYFAEVNRKGGVFGRQIQLHAVPLGWSPEASLESLSELFASEGVLALVGPYTVGLDDALLGLLRLDNVPLIGPFTLDPGDAFTDSAAFYLFAGLDEQARVLADRSIADGASSDKVLIVAPQGGRAEPIAKAAKLQLRKSTQGDPPKLSLYSAADFDAAGVANTTATGDFEALIFLGEQPQLNSLIRELSNRAPVPRIYLLSALISQPLLNLPAVFDGRVFLAYPTLSNDISPQGRLEYQALAEAHSLPTDHIQAQLASLAAAKLFVEGLRKAGRDLSRVRLVEALESLYGFKTGVTPKLSYGPNRRIGARGAHVVMVDLENQTYRPVGKGWFELE